MNLNFRYGRAAHRSPELEAPELPLLGRTQRGKHATQNALHDINVGTSAVQGTVPVALSTFYKGHKSENCTPYALCHFSHVLQD